MLRRLMLHIVEEPVLRRKTVKRRASQCVAHPKYRQRRCCGLKKHAKDKGVCQKKKHGMLPFFCFTSTGKLILHD